MEDRNRNAQQVRMARRTLLRAITVGLSLWVLMAPGVLASGLKVLDTSPEDGAVLDRPVRSLRVWFDQAPDVQASELSLAGPAGAELEVTGLHTMGEEDLMARIVGRMPDGEYTATWRVGSGPDAATGSWTFEVRRSSGEAGVQERSTGGGAPGQRPLSP